MKWTVPALVMFIAGCTPVPHHFAVDVKDAASPVASGVVSICKVPETALKQSGTRWTGTIANRCEGSGYIRLKHADGTTTVCPLGYVTTLEDSWTFEVKGRTCVFVS